MTPEQSGAIARALVSLREELARLRATLATGDARTAASMQAVGKSLEGLTRALEALTARVDTLERTTAPILSAEAAARAESVEWRRSVRSNPLVWVTVILLILSGGVLVLRGDALAVLGFASRQAVPVAPASVTGAP